MWKSSQWRMLYVLPQHNPGCVASDFSHTIQLTDVLCFFFFIIKWTFECKSHLLSHFLHFTFQHFIRYYLKVWLCFNIFFIQFSSLDLDQAMFQPYPSEIVFQNYSPFKTYKVSLELRNSDKVTFILLRRLYSQLHNYIMNVFKNKRYLVHLGAFVFMLVYALLWTSSSKDRNELKVIYLPDC